MNRIGVLTSGGDAPGMNAAIRGVVQSAAKDGVSVVGICRGYQGLIEGETMALNSYTVENIIHRGGTILKSARSMEFMTAEGRSKAAAAIQAIGLDGLVVIGGDGTFQGAKVFNDEYDFPIVGLPGTIDNDLYGTDFTIGYDTALNTVIEAVDKIRDTASAHDRLFFIEVMGKDAGFIALRSGIASGAEAILIPETRTDVDVLVQKINTDRDLNRQFGVIMVAEGDDAGGAFAIAAKVKQKLPTIDCKVTVLGHIQRGGAPSAADRILASALGVASVSELLKGTRGVMLGMINKTVTPTPFEEAVKHHKSHSQPLIELAKILAR